MLSFLLVLFIVYVISLAAIYWLYERQVYLNSRASGKTRIHAQIERSIMVGQKPVEPTSGKDPFVQALGDLQNQLALMEAQREAERLREDEDALKSVGGKGGADEVRHREREKKDEVVDVVLKSGERKSASGVKGQEKGKGKGKEKKALVVLGHNRPELVERILLLFARMKHVEDYHVYLSVDSLEKIAQFRRLVKRVEIARMVRDLWVMPEGFRKPTHAWHQGGLFKISEHFRFVMETAFEKLGHSHLILQEDDLMPGRDFLVLFNRTQWLLDADPNVWCISAWNDYSFRSVARDTSVMLKTDFFPGLGWMLKRELWMDELRHVWPRFATSKL